MKHISVSEFQKLLESGLNIKVLDVREPEEYEELNLGGKSLPLPLIMQMQADEIEDWKDADRVVVHCKSGQRSLQACLFLEQMGFDNLYNLEGGITAWQELFPDEKINQENA